MTIKYIIPKDIPEENRETKHQDYSHSKQSNGFQPYFRNESSYYPPIPPEPADENTQE